MKLHYTALLILLTALTCSAQVGIGTLSPDSSSMLDITSTDRGVLIPRLTSFERDNILSPANGLIIYNTDSDEIQFNSNTPAIPIWQALSLTPVSTVAPNTSMKYSNTNITTDVNPNTAIIAPLFGTMEWNDDNTLFNVLGNTVTINETGRYEFIINVSLLNNSNTDRNAPEIRIAVDGTPVGTYGSTGYLRRANGHNESSLHIREILEITVGQIVTVAIVASGNTGEVLLRSVGSSNIYIEKLK